MNDLFKIIVKSLRGNSFYIPSKNTFVNGCSLTVKQYNELLDLNATTDFSFEQFIKYSIITDRIILDNIDKVDDMLYFDKNFILIQIKMAQENSFLGLPLADYQANLKNKMENFSLSSYETAFIDTNLKISFGLNDFQTVVKTNKEYLISLKNNYNYPGEIISLEIFKYLQNIEYLNQSITENKEIADLRDLIGDMPATLIERFNDILLKTNRDIKEMNTFQIAGEDFVFNPSLEFMLS
jgi:hypothetical protein